MFTGIIEEIGVLARSVPIPGGKFFSIKADKILDDLEIDHSVAINGVCLTVIEISGNLFTVEAVGETLEKSTFDDLKTSVPLNLERAMKLGDRLGGHLVQGHVNGVGSILKLDRRGDNWYLVVQLTDELIRYVIPEGSIAIDGISLTVASLNGTEVGVSVIPHTFKNTTFSQATIGQKCNIETDMIGKYIEKFINNPAENRDKKPITLEWLHNQGY
jgi:riboflavin synthase